MNRRMPNGTSGGVGGRELITPSYPDWHVSKAATGDKHKTYYRIRISGRSIQRL